MSLVSVAQMVSGCDVEENLSAVERLVKQASDAGSSLVLLPENFALLDSPALRSLAERDTISKFVADLAARYTIWVIAGSIPCIHHKKGEVVSPRVRSACVVFDDCGNIQARYDKIHLFDVQVSDSHGSYLESNIIEAGDELVLVDSPVGRIGLSICYDLRFPEMYQQLRMQGAELIVVPSAFTYVTGKLHWEVLLRARAVETQCFILAADQGGVHSATRQTWGQSMIVDGNGQIMSQVDQGEALLTVDVDLESLQAVREKMPMMEHRANAGF